MQEILPEIEFMTPSSFIERYSNTLTVLDFNIQRFRRFLENPENYKGVTATLEDYVALLDAIEKDEALTPAQWCTPTPVTTISGFITESWMPLAHRYALLGILPDQFEDWSILHEGLTTAHIAVMHGHPLTPDFDGWDWKTSDNFSVIEIARRYNNAGAIANFESKTMRDAIQTPETGRPVIIRRPA